MCPTNITTPCTLRLPGKPSADSAALLPTSPTQPSQKEGSRVKRAQEGGGKHLPIFEMRRQVWRGYWYKGIWSQLSTNRRGILGRTEELQRQMRGMVEICLGVAPTCGVSTTPQTELLPGRASESQPGPCGLSSVFTMVPVFLKSPRQPADQLEASMPSSPRKDSSKITANCFPLAVSQALGHAHQRGSSNQRSGTPCPLWTCRMFQRLPSWGLGNNI